MLEGEIQKAVDSFIKGEGETQEAADLNSARNSVIQEDPN